GFSRRCFESVWSFYGFATVGSRAVRFQFDVGYATFGLSCRALRSAKPPTARHLSARIQNNALAPTCACCHSSQTMDIVDDLFLEVNVVSTREVAAALCISEADAREMA